MRKIMVLAFMIYGAALIFGQSDAPAPEPAATAAAPEPQAAAPAAEAAPTAEAASANEAESLA